MPSHSFPPGLFPARTDAHDEGRGRADIVVRQGELVLVEEEAALDRHFHFLDGHARQLGGDPLFELLYLIAPGQK